MLLLAACGPDLSPATIVLAPARLPIRDLEIHDLRFEAPPSTPILITVAGHGVDVKAAVIEGDEPPHFCDAPNRRMGVETLLVPAPHAGQLTLRIQRSDHGGAAGTATVQARALLLATDDDRRRLAGAGHDAAGCMTFPQVERADEAVAAYLAAAAAWRSLRQDRQEGIARLHAAGAHYLRQNDWARSAEQSASAFRKLDSVAGSEHAAFALQLEGAALDQLARSSGFDPSRQEATVQRARERLTQAAIRFDGLAMPYEAGYALSYRGVSLQDAGEFDRAKADFESSLERFKAAGDKPAQAIALQNLAFGSLEEGRYADAAIEFERALELIPPIDDRANYAHTLHNSALPLPTLGRFDEAIGRHHEAARVLRELGDRDGEARALHSLGSVMLYAGEHDRAAELLQSAVRLRRDTGARREQAIALLNLGEVERAAGRLDASISLGRQALSLVTAPHDRAKVLLSLGRDQIHAANLPAARAQLDALLALPLPARHRYRSLALVELAAIEAQQGLSAESEARFTQAIAIQEQAGLDFDRARSLERRAEARLRRGELQPAISDSGLALRLFDTIGLQSLQTESRALFRASYRDTVELRIAALLQAAQEASPGDTAMAQRHLKAAFDASDRARAQLLTEGLRPAAGAVPAKLLVERQDVYEQLLSKRRQRDRLQEVAAPDEARIAALSRDIELLRTRAQLIDGKVAAPLAAVPGPWHPDALAPVAAVPPGVLVAEYFVGRTRSWLFEARNGQVKAHDLGPSDGIERMARELHVAWRTLPRDPRGRLGLGTAAARALFGPLGGVLPSAGILIVPDGALHLVPMATLARLAWPASPPGSAVLVPSMSAVGSASAIRVPPPRALAVVADPIYERGDPRIRTQARAANPLPGRAFLRLAAQERLRRLPSAAIEARELAALVADANGTLNLTGADASRARIIAEPLALYRIVHFATHAFADSRDPALSTLALSYWSADGEPVSGALRVYDIAQMRFNADLVVLSGCETALGREIAGEGPIGLSHAFLKSGARAVLATLWQVPDTATAALMREFYRGLLDGGHTAPIALAQAQLRLRSQPRWQDPYFWAGFQLVSNAPLESGNNNDVAGREES